MRKNQFLKVENNLLELEKNVIELEDRELKDSEVKIKRDVEELFHKPIMVFIDDMDKFEQNQMNRIRPIKNTWYHWLINYIHEPIRKSVSGLKDKIVNLFKTNTPKQTVYGRGKKLSKPKTQNIRNYFILKKKKKIKDRMIRDICTLFETEEEKKRKKEIGGKKETNERLIKDRIIRDIRTLFEREEEDHYKPKRVGNIWKNKYIE